MSDLTLNMWRATWFSSYGSFHLFSFDSYIKVNSCFLISACLSCSLSTSRANKGSAAISALSSAATELSIHRRSYIGDLLTPWYSGTIFSLVPFYCLFSNTINEFKVSILRVRIDCHPSRTFGALHSKFEDRGREIFPNFLLFCVVPCSLSDHFMTCETPYIEWHFESAPWLAFLACLLRTEGWCGGEDFVRYRTIRIPWSSFRARARRGCCFCCVFSEPFVGSKFGG